MLILIDEAMTVSASGTLIGLNVLGIAAASAPNLPARCSDQSRHMFADLPGLKQLGTMYVASCGQVLLQNFGLKLTKI